MNVAADGRTAGDRSTVYRGLLVTIAVSLSVNACLIAVVLMTAIEATQGEVLGAGGVVAVATFTAAMRVIRFFHGDRSGD